MQEFADDFGNHPQASRRELAAPAPTEPQVPFDKGPPYLERQVAPNNRQLDFKADHKRLKVTHNYKPPALQVGFASRFLCGPGHLVRLGENALPCFLGSAAPLGG